MKDTNKRPLFSVVISCYNSGDYLDYLLTTLTQQGIKKDEYEIIISDDCSTIKYNEVLDKYRDKLNIKYIEADHNYGTPGHTREQGVSIATGEWVTFSDHDDGFFKNGLKKVKRYIKKEKPEFMIQTKVQIGDFNSKNPTLTNDIYGITHGEFFNLDNLWKKFDLHYDWENIPFHEDIYINSLITNLSLSEKIVIHNAEIFVYCWMHNENSLGSGAQLNRVMKNGRMYLDNGYISYIKIVLARMIEEYQDNNNMHYFDMSEWTENVIQAITILYHYYSVIQYKNKLVKIPLNPENDAITSEYIKKFKEIVSFDNDIILDYVAPEQRREWINIALMFCGDCYYTETFRQWLDRLSPDK